MKRTLLWSLVLGPALLLAALVLPATASAAGPITTASSCSYTGTATVTCNLWAEAGTLALPGTSVTAWGFATADGAAPSVPGPAIVVNEGDSVTVNVTNHLAVTTGVTFDGQAMIPDLSGIAPGGAKSYAFTASAPGTYLYEAGLIPGTQYQVSMGLYGVLIVRPALAPGQAYADAGSAFDGEALVVMSEIDPKLNNAVDPAAFDLRWFAPRYQLVNGVAYSSTAPAIPATSGQRLLLRYVNAGIQHHSMAVLGLHQAELAIDGNRLPANRTFVAQTINPGESFDALVTLPASDAASTKYAVYDATLLLNNNGGATFGGMLTFIDAGPSLPTGTDTTGPATTDIALDTGTGALSATVSDAGFGDATVAAAEFFVDSSGAPGTGTPMAASDLAFDQVTEAVTGTVSIPVGGWSTGTHTVYVRGQDSAGNWGPFASYSFVVDVDGPTVSGLSLTPSAWNGTGDVSLSGTASDLLSGGSNVVAWEYVLGTPNTGPSTQLSIAVAAPVVSLSATISASDLASAFGSGNGGAINVRAQDAVGNWGAFTTVVLTPDSAGPTTSGVAIAPNPSNGLVPINTAYPALLVTASVTDVGSGGNVITAAEGFIDTVGAPGTGFPFSPTDGVFNSATEGVSAYIPLTTIRQLTDGSHTIYVRGRDAAGNWGATASGNLVVDKTAPTISSVSIVPNSIPVGTATVQLNVTASDALTGIAAGQYWIDGSATPPAAPTAFDGTSATVDTAALTVGIHAVYVRVRDAAMNWSSVSSATLTVTPIAVDDFLTISANTNATQNVNVAAPGLLANDLPPVAGRTTSIASAPVRTSGTGAGTVTISCPSGLGTAATPPVGGSTVCTNGAYRVTLNGVGGTGAARRASKWGTFTFTYTLTLNGATSTATVTITVN